MLGLRGEVIEDHGELAELEGDWRGLCDACPSATPFQRPEWLLAWARHFGPARPRSPEAGEAKRSAGPRTAKWSSIPEAGAAKRSAAPRRGKWSSIPEAGEAKRSAAPRRAKWLLAVRERGRLLGLAPLIVHERVLGFLGAGVSDYLDVVIAPGRERAVLDAMLTALAARSDLWDRCELESVRPWASPLTREAVPGGWSTRILARGVCPSLPLPPRVDELDHSVPRRHLRRFWQYRRRAARAGSLRLERATPQTCERLLDTLIRLHQVRWRERAERGCLAEPDLRCFHREIVVAFAARDALALYVLYLDNRAIAGLYGFEERRCLYFYLCGFDPEFASLSPGALVIGMVLEDAIRRGLERFDFLRGGETYKYWWGAEDRSIVCLSLIGPRD